ncbi:hypothetical protein Tco_0960263 [Tanacetum coccineum]
MQNVPYASAIGSIMYAVRCTRPDVAFAQNITSRFQQNPGEEHWIAYGAVQLTRRDAGFSVSDNQIIARISRSVMDFDLTFKPSTDDVRLHCASALVGSYVSNDR